jgi:uncharacterized protein involved in exopolysaccharide biosynthesis
MHISSQNKSNLNYEIDLIALVKTLWKKKMILFRFVIVFGFLGLLIAVYSTKVFLVSSVMIPSGNEMSSKIGSLGGLGGLAAMAGININSVSGNDLSPIVYPQIVASLPFQLELLKTPLNFIDYKEPITFYDYCINKNKNNENLFLKYTLGLPGLILKAIKGNEPEKPIIQNDKEPLSITMKQYQALLILNGLISLEVNVKDGLLTLYAKMPEARAAAQLGQRTQELLQRYITEFKINKAKNNLDFIQQRYDETKQKFEAAQQSLASFRDRNKNVSVATVKTEEETINSQYNLIYSIFSELGKQLEQAKIQVKQDTPVFIIIEPISVPIKRFKPNRPLILIIWLLMGGIIGTAFVFYKEYSSSFINKLKEN